MLHSSIRRDSLCYVATDVLGTLTGLSLDSFAVLLVDITEDDEATSLGEMLDVRFAHTTCSTRDDGSLSIDVAGVEVGIALDTPVVLIWLHCEHCVALRVMPMLGIELRQNDEYDLGSTAPKVLPRGHLLPSAHLI